MLKRTRFAPSPTGPLHLGHAYAALVAAGRADPGQFLLRIEDLDAERSKPQWEGAIYDDLGWLGLDWQRPVLRQSERRDAYQDALGRLVAMGLCYPCSCSRADIRAALSAPQEGAPAIGPDGPVYPGTCRHRRMAEAGPSDAIRLDMRAAIDRVGARMPRFQEAGPTHAGLHILDKDHMISDVGDVVLSRRVIGPAYHLAVTVDDAFQQISEVTRGEDLFEATRIHVLLQQLLGVPTPAYFHHPLIRDPAGRRLAKRDDARALSLYRAEGLTPRDIKAKIGL
ncbi:tRNA glutamyl-Q(34) synthetase GluQRS [Frigidibacter sp. MR17.24]|uniref:tRNA glutamyl-Q(34) synthetase GluQRS n=1 Tax=Frigidibacter sp. MR17.24 TaxID=3127345 RepID=UPI003012CE6A